MYWTQWEGIWARRVVPLSTVRPGVGVRRPVVDGLVGGAGGVVVRSRESESETRVDSEVFLRRYLYPKPFLPLRQ